MTVRNNQGFTEVEPLITVEKLKTLYLFGLLPILDPNGNPLPDWAFQDYINKAVSRLTHELDLAIMPRSYTADNPEEKDYYANEYVDWSYFQLNNYPVISVEKISVSYLRDSNGAPESILDIPKEWIRLDKASGIVRLVPSNRFPANLQVGAGGSFFPELFNRHSMAPQVWTFQYTYGFEPGRIPSMINDAIGLMASIQALDIGGDLVLGAGIASSSISMDGLSQSINTTSSAENHAYSAKRDAYRERLFGKNASDSGLIGAIKAAFKGTQINII